MALDKKMDMGKGLYIKYPKPWALACRKFLVPYLALIPRDEFGAAQHSEGIIF